MSHLARAPRSQLNSSADAGVFGQVVETRIRHAILHDLTTEQRLLILLWHAEGMNPDEISVILNTTPERVVELHESLVARIRHAAKAPLACV